MALKAYPAEGFTLIEVLLVVAIITIVTAVGAPVYLSFQNSNELDVATNTLSQYLYEAQSNSRVETDNCGWGVTISGSQVILYCGSSFASRNSAFDVSYQMPVSISVQNNHEVNYSKLYGLPSTTGPFNLTDNGKTSTVTVNAKGMVEY